MMHLIVILEQNYARATDVELRERLYEANARECGSVA